MTLPKIKQVRVWFTGGATAEKGAGGGDYHDQGANHWIDDLVLMDIVMPGLNGFQATRQLTKDPETLSLGLGLHGDQAHFFEHGPGQARKPRIAFGLRTIHFAGKQMNTFHRASRTVPHAQGMG